MKRRIAALLLGILCFLSGCSIRKEKPSSAAVPAGESAALRVHFLDVGQADCELIELPGGKLLMIDAGEDPDAGTVISYIRALGHEKVDILIGTHPHSDHIGGMAAVIRAFDIGEVYLPRATANTKVYESLLLSCREKGLGIHTAAAGKTLSLPEGVTGEFLAPVSQEADSLNNVSAVLRLCYGNTAFLFMGDAETKEENEITGDVTADCVKVGHHGSNTSSGEEFVRKTGASFAVISCGRNNSYGHPSAGIVSRWQGAGATVFRTDELGTILAVSDGKTVSVNGKSAPDPQSAVSDPGYLLNTKTKKVHYVNCQAAKNISPENRAYTHQSLSQLYEQGYMPCGSCRPVTDQEERKNP